jgi:predicted acyl esterase
MTLSRKMFGLLLAWLLTAALVPSIAGSAAAADPDPLVSDGLTALNSLVEEPNCVVKDAADAETATDTELPFTLCDDGVSSAGTNGIPVPAVYHPTGTDDFTGLPVPASEEETATADAKYDVQPEGDNRITLDVDISLPQTPAPEGGYPVMVFMHGCCGGNRKSWEAESVDGSNELWHNSNAYFASQGYVVLNYTARGFRDKNGDGSTGTTQLDSRRFEINDYQYLLGLMADDDANKRAAGADPLFNINPKKVGVNGGSYGGGFGWLALTDPTWKSLVHGVRLKMGALVTKYGWTDLVEALVPSGHYSDRDPNNRRRSAVAPSRVALAPSQHPIGVEKQSTVTGLYATGQNEADNHTTFPAYMNTTYERLQEGEPYDGDPDVESTLKMFLRDRSAYYQKAFWHRVRNGLRVPIYAAATWTDPLFPTMETVRFYNKLRKIAPKYPITMYLGDYQHLYAQNKAKEWDSLCGPNHHVCTVDDYRDGDGIHLRKANNEVRAGALARADKFLHFYLKGRGKKPASDVSATTTICSSNATKKLPVDEPGIEYRAPTWRKIAPRIKSFHWNEGGTTSNLAPDANAVEADPVARNRQSEKCLITDQENGPGVVTLTADPFKKPVTLLGVPWVEVAHTTSAKDYWLAVRMYDKDSSGEMTMVTRGVCRVNKTSDPNVHCRRFDLWGNAWRFRKGDSVVLELTESDTPTFRKDNFPSTLTINSVDLHMPRTVPSLKHDFRSPASG